METFDAGAVYARIAATFEARRDAAQAQPMAAYMRHQFPFLGIPTPARRPLLREALAGMEPPTEADLRALAALLWAKPEREYQYAACDILGRWQGRCGPGFLPVAKTLITRKSWWDTVDSLAARVVGPIVRRHRELAATMDAWLTDDQMWLARTAILHQLAWKGQADSDRLFRYCAARATDREFFIRKAIGWALREHSKTDAEAVRAFVAAHPELSGLSQREALLWLNGGRGAKRALPVS